MGDYILEAIQITKKFPGVIANDNVCLNAKKGEILGLIGENGAGKSTILKILNGIYPSGSYTGTLKINDQVVEPKSPQDAIELGIGFVPQEINVLNNFSVAENIYMSDLKLGNKKAKTVNFKALFQKTEKLLSANQIDLDPKADVRKLSIGQQQMLMIARALASEPQILILDEPTTSLSTADVESLFEVVRHLKEKGTSVIFVTHKLAEILELTDRVTILRDGKNISSFDKADYQSDKIIADMIGRKMDNLYPTRNAKIGDVVLEIKGLSVAHPHVQNRNLIENVSLEVRAGQVVGLAGLVGAGRTEVVSTIYGMYKPSAGQMFMNGKELKIRNTTDAVKAGIALASEDRKKYGLNFVWDIKKNIAISNLNAISAANIFVSGKKEEKRADKYFNEMHIKAPSLKTKVGTLSGGNQQKVVLARCLNAEPKLIILDEPTKGIDVGSKNEIYQLINQLAEEGNAVLMISSELPELMAMSDHFIIMAEGRVVGELDKSEATDSKIMEMAVSTFK
ncbi:MAG: sugar ABC transporter ATP-binding protein [Christensenella sp.]|nr:sugar ABC transporter ATP-binding protein [Christensenella sp.]MEA5002996.1 sugar ABC transporter ATP-binding protein [Christensenella sp.]